MLLYGVKFLNSHRTPILFPISLARDLMYVPFPQMTNIPASSGMNMYNQTPFNFSMFPQFNLSNYAQQGIANPNLINFNRVLSGIA